MAKDRTEQAMVRRVGGGLQVNQDALSRMLEAAGVPEDITNRQAIDMVADAIVAEVAEKSPENRTVADAFALRAALGAKEAPTAGQEVEAILQRAGLIQD